MNDLDVRHAVQAAGEDISPATRRQLADLLRAELAGEPVPPMARVVALDTARRRRLGLWGGLGLAGVAAATVTALAITRDDRADVVVTDTGPDATMPVTSPDGSAVPPPISTAATDDTTPVSGPASTAPSTPVVPASAPGATSQASAEISPDSLKQPLVPIPVVDLGVVPVPVDRYDLTPQLSFLPDGGLLVLDRQAATAQVVEPTGTVRWTSSIPAAVGGGAPWDASLGPDGVLYVSYVIGDAAAPESFTLAAIPISGPSASEVVAQWPTEWQCVEGTCGEVTLEATGIRVLWQEGDDALAPYVDATGQPSGATYAVSTLEQVPSIGETPLPDGYVDSTGYGGYAVGGLDVSLGDDAWHLDALGVRFIEGSFTYASQQPDGAVLAQVSTTKDSALAGVTTLVRMLPGGAIEQYLPPQLAYAAVASVDGALFAVQTTANDGGTEYALVALVPEGETATGTVETVVPTTEAPTPSGLPAAVASLPTFDQTLSKGEDRLRPGGDRVPLGSVLVARADGSGDVFASTQADDGSGALVLVRPDGSTVDLGIPIGQLGGVVSSDEDRLYVWDRTAFSGDAQTVTWTVYEPEGTDSWRSTGAPTLQTAAGECSFYVSGEGCRSAEQVAPLVAGDAVDWAVASPDLSTLTVSIGGSATIRELVEPDLAVVQCFDLNCSFQFAPGPDGLVYAWHQVLDDDGTTRTAWIAMHPDGSSVAAWLPGADWYVLPAGSSVIGWHLDAEGAVDSITTWQLTGL